MAPRNRNLILGSGLVLVVCLAAIVYVVPRSDVLTESLPGRIADRDFWTLVSDFSENGGFFRSDNFVSNETTFQYVIPDLKERTKPGGVYLGVGPDQNFTYIAAIRPKVAFIVDIRKQNMLEHLMYKALFELSEDRAQFLSRLFSRRVPAGAGDAESEGDRRAASRLPWLLADRGRHSDARICLLGICESRSGNPLLVPESVWLGPIPKLLPVDARGGRRRGEAQLHVLGRKLTVREAAGVGKPYRAGCRRLCR